LPERTELWYDDGVAEPEYYYNRDFIVTNTQAAAQLFGAFAFLASTIGLFCYLVDDSFRNVRATPAVAREAAGLRQWGCPSRGGRNFMP